MALPPGLPEPDAKVGELVAAGDGMPAVSFERFS
jgi:hypothetical protein